MLHSFRALLLVEILEQPIGMLKNERSIILRWKYLYNVHAMFRASTKLVPNKYQTSCKQVPNQLQTSTKPVPYWIFLFTVILHQPHVLARDPFAWWRHSMTAAKNGRVAQTGSETGNETGFKVSEFHGGTFSKTLNFLKKYIKRIASIVFIF